MRTLGLGVGERERGVAVLDVDSDTSVSVAERRSTRSFEDVGVRVALVLVVLRVNVDVGVSVEGRLSVAEDGEGEDRGLRFPVEVGLRGGCSVAFLTLTRILPRSSSRRGRRSLGSQRGWAVSIK